MISIRKGLALVLAAALVIIAGCTGSGTGGQDTPDKGAGGGEDPVTITFWHAMNEDSAHGKVLAQLVKDFNAAHDHIQVKAQYQGSYGDLEKKVAAALAARTAPTVVQNTDSMLTRLVASDAVQPLNDLIPREELNDYIPALLKATTYGDRLMALPFNKSAVVLIYDKTLVSDPPETWEEFAQLAKALTVPGERYGTALEANVYEFGSHFAQAGGEWLANNKPAFHNEAGVEALTFITDLIRNGYAVQLKPKEYKSNYFSEGRAAMIAATSASYAYIKPKSGNPWGVAPLYAGPAGKATPLSGANVSIIAEDKGVTPAQTRAAAEFIIWLTNKENTLRWGMGKTGYGPVRLSAIEDAEWKAFARENPEYGVLAEVLPHGVVQPTHPKWKAVQNEITSAVQAAFLGEASPEDALKAAAAKAEGILNK